MFGTYELALDAQGTINVTPNGMILGSETHVFANDIIIDGTISSTATNNDASIRGAGYRGSRTGSNSYNYGGSGGAHGGNSIGAGGNAGSSWGEVAAFGSVSRPWDYGGRGGNSGYYEYKHGGNGGGRIRITAGTSLVIQGSIQANGGGGAHASDTSYRRAGGGGGAGGSVQLTAPSITGGGVVTANGGNGGNSEGQEPAATAITMVEVVVHTVGTPSARVATPDHPG
eukprot:gene4513-5527_t